MKNNRNIKRRGFTLVELLIVIVVIGVLSAMMMLSSTEAVSSARASNIVSNLRNLKTAALSWYADHLDDVANLNDLNDATHRPEVLKYLNNNSDTGELANYKFTGNKNDNTWFVYIDVQDAKVGAKLRARKSSVGLYKVTANSGKGGTSADLTTDTGNIGMFIR